MFAKLWPQAAVGTLILTALVWYGSQPVTRFEHSPLPPSPEPRITVLLGGDVNMGRRIGQQLLAGNTDYPFVNIAETLQSADLTFVNLESQLADLDGETQSPTNEFRFAGPPEGATSLKNAGIDIVSVANNHMWDYGKDRLFATLDYLDREGIRYVGASRTPADRYSPLITEHDGIKIGWLALTTLLNGYEKFASEYVSFNNSAEIINQITQIRDRVDYVFVSIHTGTEYQTTPGNSMVTLARQLVDAGADVIIGHHPHVPQPIEVYKEKPIFYSLGNFAFWQPFSFWTQHSYLASLDLTKTELNYEIIPVKAGWQPELLTDPKSSQRLLELLNSSVE